MNLFIKYKNYDFNVIVESNGDENIERTIISIDSSDPIVEQFNNDVFFDQFVGFEYSQIDEARVVRRIKRAFSTFISKTKNPVEVKEVSEEVVVSKSTSKETTKPEGAIDRIIFETVERALSSEDVKVNIDQIIKGIIDENGIVPFRTVLEVKTPEGVKKDVGLQHFEFERILRTISAGVNIALVGPAGSGKTTMVKNVAEALGKSFSSQAVSAQSTTFDFFGYKNVKGDYITTLFREKYEKGGVYLLDEFDAGNPNVLAALNQATANDLAPFPDKMVKRHKDFIMVMAGNTYGMGGTIQYVGRNKLDAATLDRYAFIYVGYDEDLEEKLSTNKEWCRKVQKFRRRIKEKKVQTIVSPRATFMGEKLLSAGLAVSQVEEMLIYKGLNSDERNLISISQ